jgi:protocatechuate 3,4-dioxygenase beta subunit
MRVAVIAVILGSVVVGAAIEQPTAPPQPGVPIPGLPTPGQPTRMPPRATRPGEDPQRGTSVLRGYVTAADTGNPVRRALIRALSQDGRSSGMATTDADGRFEIRDLQGGRYNLTATKAGYVTMSYGQRRPEQAGTVLEILEGTTVDKLAFSLPRGGVITGNVLDEFGDPIAGAFVNALRYRYSPGGRRLMPSGSAQTDDRGAFRIYGLAPGDYFVSSVLRPPQMMMVGPGTMASGPVEGYAPTYYPGTPNPAEASRVTVRAGQEASNISMALIAVRLARVSGRAINSRGAPVVQGMVMATPTDRLSLGVMTGAPAITGPDGTFQILGLAPGTYNIQLRGRGTPSPDSEFATIRVTVGTSDVDGILLTTSRGAIARGMITTDEGTPPPVLPEQISLFARQPEPEPMAILGESRVNADWTFEMSGLSDARLITANVAQNSDWALKAVLHNGIEVTDTPIEFVPGQVFEGISVVLTRKLTQLSGQVIGDRNAPDTDATVIAFSQDSDRWTSASRYLRTARPNQDGRYTLRGLPPHDYFIVAVKDIEPGQSQDPEFLESVRSQAVRISLTEGEATVQDLKISRQ